MIAQSETPSLNSTLSLPYPVAGLVQVFTSTQRNFFTDVIAQSLRIAGQGTPVLVVQFLKGGIRQGQERPIQLGQNLDWIRCDLPRCIDTPHLDAAEDQALQQLWQYTQQVVSESKYALVVLDELSLAINFGLIPETEVLEFLAQRPPHVDIILTGTQMPKSLLDMADQITEIRRSHRP
ncbi:MULTISPECIES: P-loop NTPase family protein [unclassified Nodularia (in: cyanobacteria)]|uniref:P-loop NTPase family protein n=1 Tax=unclassified Nodularia (in: cyanobacteria) TaxID=2656917 RepID=UPI001881AE52|nr:MULTISPECIES: P-loop NTPase family protein [unclassified Nodularia (in: cyanobacteria)]MBE9198704.1 P-loop NTPase family protein [Nodularia sp. LEGE 06071]MCC2694580.1 P-loop NTPase family protein [Nodularia sp. LEGE 04288]